MRGIFFWKKSKIWPKFRKCKIKLGKVLSFWDNCIWMGCIKFSLLGREHLPRALIVLTNSLNLWHMYKRDFLHLNCLHFEQWICCRCYRWDLNIVDTCLPCCFFNGNLKRDLLHIYLTTFFAGRILANK